MRIRLFFILIVRRPAEHLHFAAPTKNKEGIKFEKMCLLKQSEEWGPPEVARFMRPIIAGAPYWAWQKCNTRGQATSFEKSQTGTHKQYKRDEEIDSEEGTKVMVRSQLSDLAKIKAASKQSLPSLSKDPFVPGHLWGFRFHASVGYLRMEIYYRLTNQVCIRRPLS